MELDRSYFNSIRLNTHRGKFYDVEAVDRLLVDIRSRADALNREVIASREKLAEAEKTSESLREENSELFLKGQALSQEILSLREELRAAQAGEASLIPEEEQESDQQGEPSEEATWEEKEEFYFLTEELPEPKKHTEIRVEETAPAEEAPDKNSAEREESLHLQEEAEREAEEILSRAGAERDRILTVERMERVFAMLKEISTYTIEKSERIREEYLKAVAGEEAPGDLSEKIGRIAAELNEMDEEE